MFHSIIKWYSVGWLVFFSGGCFLNVFMKEPQPIYLKRYGYLVGSVTGVLTILLILGII